jgi:hypothetical protein
MLRIAIGLVLLAHGIGHSLGLLQTFRIAQVNPEWHGDSWLLTGIAGATLTQAAGVLVWTAAIVGFAGLAAVVMGWLPESLWVPLGLASATVSLLGIALFPTAFPVGSTIGAGAVNVVLLAAIAWAHWSPADLAA